MPGNTQSMPPRWSQTSAQATRDRSAGIEAATPLVVTPLLVVIACDVPRLPGAPRAAIIQHLAGPPGKSAPPTPFQGGRSHYLCAMLRTESLTSLSAFSRRRRQGCSPLVPAPRRDGRHISRPGQRFRQHQQPRRGLISSNPLGMKKPALLSQRGLVLLWKP